MIHFIPAWYNPTRPWYSAYSVWFEAAASAESDDTVTQLRVFQQGSEDVGLIVLNYAPSLRRFLHSQNVFDVPYWSLFDQIQGLENDYTRPLDFLKLEWPEDVSFYYNPFVVTVMQDNDVYARVLLALGGTLRSIRYYADGLTTLERIFDDRGFLSSVLMYDEDGQAITQYYLSRTGDVILSEDLPSGHIDVLQNEDRFQSQSYDRWEDLIAEFLGAHLRQRSGEGDTVVLALSAQHNELVRSVLEDQTLVLSRLGGKPANASSDLLQRAGAVFSGIAPAADDDSAEQADEWMFLPELSIYPLEHRPTFGASANESKVYVSLFVDNLTTEDLDYAIAMMAGVLVGDDRTRLLPLTFRSRDLDYLRGIRGVINGYQHLDLALLGGDETAGLGADLGVADGPEEKIQLTFVDGEADLIRTIGRSRVLIDLGSTVNHRLAVEAVSAGVPQVNRSEQELCTHPINGYVIGDDSELPTAVSYFLSGLEHWNQSLVQCRVLEDLFSAQEVLNRWGLIKEVAAYAGPADRV